MARIVAVVAVLLGTWVGWAAAEDAMPVPRIVKLYVDPAKGNDANAGTAEKPLATVAKALALAVEGQVDVIQLADGKYGALEITTKFPRQVILAAGPAPAAPVQPLAPGGATVVAPQTKPLFERIAITDAENVTLSGLHFSVPDAKTEKHVYVSVSKSKHIVLRDLQIAGEVNQDWAAKKSIGLGVGDSEDVTVAGGFIRYTQFGVTVSRVKKISVSNMDIGPFREDGVRFKNCDGVVCENCHIHDAHKTKAEHCDGIQMIYWSHNVVLRNNHIHNVNQGIGAFSEDKEKRRNWRIEGNLIYNIYNPNTMSIYDAESPVIVNNTLPQAGVNLRGTTGAIVKGNIMAFPGAATSSEAVKEEDYNLFMSLGNTKEKPRGSHDLVSVDPQFVDAAKFDFRLKSGSPAIDSGTAEFARGADLQGRKPHDVPEVKNTGAGEPAYVDRGALEYVPPEKK